jgi:hypothetical protein
MKRRDFVKNSIIASSGTIFINSVLGCANHVLETENINSIFSGFQNPPVDSRVFVRWW